MRTAVLVDVTPARDVPGCVRARFLCNIEGDTALETPMLPVDQTPDPAMLPLDQIPSLAETQRVYAAVGDEGFRALVEAFYRRVEADPLLRPIFPPDLSAGREHQYLFLRQYFGGPTEYNERRGHPQLRRRHLPFPITREARDAWLSHMLAAIDEVGIPEPHAGVMRRYFEVFSVAMITRP